MSLNIPPSEYRFGRFALQPAEQRLLADGELQSIGPRAFEVLVALVERAGQLVAKNELLDLVWPGLVVEENNLQVQVSALRKILGADAIATVAGRGYRFTRQLEHAVLPQTPHVARKALGLPAREIPSIAVLPFFNTSGDVANEYFADGLADEMLNVLSKIRGLRVASRTSAFSFKGASVDIPTVAKKLNVATILEGSVRTAGNRVRITAHLVHVATDSHLWSETYDREMEDIFAVQDDIARSVVKELRATLLGEQPDLSRTAPLTAEIQAAIQGRSKNVEAYRLYLQGNFFANRFNKEDMAKAVRYLREALALDPGSAMTWARLSNAHVRQATSAWAPIAEGAELARDAAMRALHLEPDLGIGHGALGRVQMFYDWNWKGAAASCRRALESAPDDSELVVFAITLARYLGNMDEADALLVRALALDPLNVRAHAMNGHQHLFFGRFIEAEVAFKRALDLEPQFARVHLDLAGVYLYQRRLDAALGELEQEVDECWRLFGIAVVQHAREKTAESETALQELIRKFAAYAAFQIAAVYAYRGDIDRAFEWLERAYKQRDSGLAASKISLSLRNLHSDARWVPFLEKMGLAD